MYNPKYGLWDMLSQFGGKVAQETVGTPYGQFIRGIAGSKDRVYGTEIFKDNEVALLQDLALDSIKTGKYHIGYKDIGSDKLKNIGYNMELPENIDARDALTFTLGTSSIKRSGDRIIVVDEYDFESPEQEPEELSMYGLAHKIGEFTTPSGSRASIRADLGSREELGLSEKQFNNIPDLESYEETINNPDSWEKASEWIKNKIL